MSTRRPHEVEVYLWRGRGDPEVLLLRRCARLGGFWHVVAGAVEPGETEAAAAARELREETGLDVAVADSGVRYAYPVDDDRRHLFAPEVREIAVACFCAEVPEGAEIRLDWEHDELAWHPISRAAQVLHHPAVARAMEGAVTGRR
jgi:8-oxo-dGTP pyrophosphatase MutT (NUDIX family)